MSKNQLSRPKTSLSIEERRQLESHTSSRSLSPVPSSASFDESESSVIVLGGEASASALASAPRGKFRRQLSFKAPLRATMRLRLPTSALIEQPSSGVSGAPASPSRVGIREGRPEWSLRVVIDEGVEFPFPRSARAFRVALRVGRHSTATSAAEGAEPLWGEELAAELRGLTQEIALVVLGEEEGENKKARKDAEIGRVGGVPTLLALAEVPSVAGLLPVGDCGALLRVSLSLRRIGEARPPLAISSSSSSPSSSLPSSTAAPSPFSSTLLLLTFPVFDLHVHRATTVQLFMDRLDFSGERVAVRDVLQLGPLPDFDLSRLPDSPRLLEGVRKLALRGGQLEHALLVRSRRRTRPLCWALPSALAMQRMALAVDGCANARLSMVGALTPTLRSSMLRALYGAFTLPFFAKEKEEKEEGENGENKKRGITITSPEGERWTLDADGRVDGAAGYRWTGEALVPRQRERSFGEGRTNGLWLSWGLGRAADGAFMRYLWVPEAREFVTPDAGAGLTRHMRWTQPKEDGVVIARKGEEWRASAEVPPLLVMMLQIMRYARGGHRDKEGEDTSSEHDEEEEAAAALPSGEKKAKMPKRKKKKQKKNTAKNGKEKKAKKVMKEEEDGDDEKKRPEQSPKEKEKKKKPKELAEGEAPRPSIAIAVESPPSSESASEENDDIMLRAEDVSDEDDDGIDYLSALEPSLAVPQLSDYSDSDDDVHLVPEDGSSKRPGLMSSRRVGKSTRTARGSHEL